MDPQTWRWWTLLRGCSVLNIAAFLATAGVLAGQVSGTQAIQLACAGIYVAVCAFRSFWPRVDLERVVLVDHPLSSIVLGRTSATIAEMAFTVQCALFVADLAVRTQLPFGGVAWVLVPLIAVAQLACWLGVVTLDHRWHAVEETLWGIAMALLTGVFGWSLTVLDGGWIGIVGLGLVGSLAGGFVMLALDVPMYVRRAREERAAGKPVLSVAMGFSDALVRREPTGSWDVWKHEVAWMTPYFTGCVWLSIALVWLS